MTFSCPTGIHVSVGFGVGTRASASRSTCRDPRESCFRDFAAFGMLVLLSARSGRPVQGRKTLFATGASSSGEKPLAGASNSFLLMDGKKELIAGLSHNSRDSGISALDSFRSG